MPIKWNRFNRQVHYWGSIIVAIPIFIIIVTGIILLLKKEYSWIQPPSKKGVGKVPTVQFDQILEALKTVEVAEINDWNDVDRLDVRPSKGIAKVQSNNAWEVQVDLETAEVLQAAYRRSDFIESLHDGSFFKAKMIVFLPSAIILLILWITGIYLFFKPILNKRKRRAEKKFKRKADQT
ncbi:MAG: hypothetical protein CMO46_05695 [Verrucomicrobiales bacterium]|nr:hypothetical protein [Verrucomicrobiales bacterium]|tara:strand:- start:4215 stop:4754 length:540 start_codon:yes stop_codon:yes gene_type:complete